MTWRDDLKKALIENRSKQGSGSGTVYWNSVVDTIERFMRRHDEKEADCWDEMVAIVDLQFPRDYFDADRSRAMAMIERIYKMFIGK